MFSIISNDYYNLDCNDYVHTVILYLCKNENNDYHGMISNATITWIAGCRNYMEFIDTMKDPLTCINL